MGFFRSAFRPEASRLWPVSLERDFIESDYGTAYDATPTIRATLARIIRWNSQNIESKTAPEAQLILAREILSLSPFLCGDVIQCGAGQGSLTASLSHVCKLVRRNLIVCDDFDEEDGGIVRRNVLRFGASEPCEFVRGDCAEALQSLHRPFALAVLGAKQAESCLRYIQPTLRGSAYIIDTSGHVSTKSLRQ